jgi:Transglutaminase-like superfamily
MSKLVKFFRLSSSDRKLLMKAIVLLWVVRIGLWLLPFQRLQNLLAWTTGNITVASEPDTELVQKITLSVKRMSRYVPVSTCLARALVTVALLEEAGLPASLRIGVARSDARKLEAHAWVESNGKVVIGGSHADLSRFTVLHSVEGT